MFGAFYPFPHVLISILRVGGCKSTLEGRRVCGGKKNQKKNLKKILDGCQFSRTRVSNGDAQREKWGWEEKNK